MTKVHVALIGALLLNACSPEVAPPQTPAQFFPPEPPSAALYALPPPVESQEDAELDAVERSATPGGRAVLQAARAMIVSGVVVKGSCWDFASAVYKKAQTTSERKAKQKTVFRGNRNGPYASPAILQSGDWLFILHDDGVEHSTIFVRWYDPAQHLAIVANYIGGQREVPGDYRVMDVSQIYNVTRLD